MDSSAQGTSRKSIWPRLLLALLVLVLAALLGVLKSPAPHLQEAFLDAAESGQETQMVALLARNSRLVNVRDTSGRTPLHRAVLGGHVRAVEILLAHKADVNAKDESGNTPLHFAGLHPHGEIAKLLLEKGAKVNVEDMISETPIFIAVRAGNKDVTELLLAHGARVDIEDNAGLTPLRVAASVGHVSIVGSLISNGADVDGEDDGKATPLQWAATFERYGATKLLVENGADVNQQNGGAPPLRLATLTGNQDLVKFLLSEGAREDIFVATILGDTNRAAHLLVQDPKLARARDDQSWTPLHWAAYQDQVTIADLLLHKGAKVNARTECGTFTNGPTAFCGDTPLHYAAMGGHIEMAKLLLANQGEINAKGENDETPLHLAATQNKADMVEFLLASGASINATNRDGDTPLSAAVRLCNRQTAEALLARRADSNIGLPLFYALWNEDGYLAERLLVGGADFEAIRSGDTVLRAALRANQSGLVERFLRSGIRLDFFCSCALGKTDEVLAFLEKDPKLLSQFDTNGWTPLHYAANAGSKTVVDMLLTRGADPNYPKATKGYWPSVPGTPLHRAAGNGFEEVVELLLARGSDIEARGTAFGPSWNKGLWRWQEQLTPLQFAVARGQKRIVQLLLSHQANPNAVAWGSGEFVPYPTNRRTHEVGKPKTYRLAPHTALEYAVQSGDKDMIELLRLHGGDINQRGYETLKQSIIAGNSEMLKFLISKGANVKAKFQYGRTPLHLAALLGQKDIGEILIKAGAELEAEDECGETSLDLAVSNNHEDIANLLKEFGTKGSP